MLPFKFTMILSTLMLATLLEANEGQELFTDANCVKCHASESFKPEKSKIKTVESLTKRVKGCAINTKAQWFDEDVDTVTKHLNQKYYHFK